MRLLLILLMFLSASSCVAETANVKVTGLRLLQAADNSAQIVFDLNRPASHELFSLAATPDKPFRLVVDLYNTQLSGQLPRLPANSPLLYNLRSGVRDGKDLRVVLDLKSPAQYQSYQLPPEKNLGHRLLIVLKPGAANQAAAKPAAAPPAKTASARVSAPAQVAQLAPTAAPSQRGRPVIIALDAGHGGMDPGALGPRKTREKDVTLAIARKTAMLINKQGGMRAVLIRDKDEYLSLRERIQRARAAKADVFISIHADAQEAGQLQGGSVYMLSQRGASSEAARWLAEKENAADLLGGVKLSDKDDVLASVLLDLSQTGTLEASNQLARHVLQSMGKAGPLLHRQVQQAAFMVLRSPDVPSILVETAFISNPAEEKKLASAAYQQRMAASLVEGVRAYLLKHAPPGTQFAAKPSGEPAALEEAQAEEETVLAAQAE